MVGYAVAAPRVGTMPLGSAQRASAGRRAVLLGAAAGVALAGCSDTGSSTASTGTAPGSGGSGFLEPASTSAKARPLGSTHLGRGMDTHWRLELPPGTPKALVVMLHGAGHTADRAFVEMGLSPHVERLGIAIAAVDGGRTWWHRRGGLDGLAMVTDDLLPAALAASGLSAQSRVGLTGYSMGGYGALLAASALGRERVRGVIAHAPALFANAREASHAFDSQAEFDEFSVWTRVDRLKDVPTWIDCGTEDPFIDNDRRFAALLPGARTTFEKGDHDTSVWRPHLGAQLEWLLAQPA